MKIRYLFLILAFCFNSSWADFSNALFEIHPNVPGDNPFIIDITGEWPYSCHPGEKKPVIRQYDKGAVVVEFEPVDEYQNCHVTPTPYRVLVDMSDVAGQVDGHYANFNITVRFDGFERTVTRTIHPGILGPAPPEWFIGPETGLYHSDGLEKQGLLLARQNQRMAAYPLIYDESGSSEWVFGPGGIVEDVFFSKLYELTGGQCLGCPPPDELPELNEVGKLTLLMDSQGLVQMKVNDGSFMTYEQSEFGYGEVDIGGYPDAVSIPNLSGRWAIVESDIEPYLGSPPPTSTLPLVFDIYLKPPPVLGAPSPPIVAPPSPHPPGSASYWIRDMEGEEVAEMLCEYKTTMVCELDNTGNSDGFAVRLLSLERMILTSLSPIAGTGKIGTGTAVRID